MSVLRVISVIAIFSLSTGCASITRGSTEAFAIETIPPGAAVQLSNGLSCTTPCSVKVKRRSDLVVTIDREGYEQVIATVTSSVDGAGAAGMAGNVIFGGIIGAGVDAGTGAMHSHKPNPLKVTMVPNDAPPGTEPQINYELPKDEENESSADSDTGETGDANESEGGEVDESPLDGSSPIASTAHESSQMR